MDLNIRSIRMVVGLVAYFLGASFSAFARYDVRCGENGGRYDVLTQRCVKDSPASDSETEATEMIRSWSQAADKNKKALLYFQKGIDGCDHRGAAHQEPDMDAVESVEIQFSDNHMKKVIPVNTSCAYENSKFEKSGGRCKISFYEYDYHKKKIVLAERELTFRSGTSELKWADPKGQSFGVTSFEKITAAQALSGTRNDDTNAFVDRDGPACKLARAVDANKSSDLSAPSAPSKAPRSIGDGVQ